MGVGHLPAVVHQFGGDVAVIGVEGVFGNAPAAQLQLVDVHGLPVGVRGGAGSLPGLVVPCEAVQGPDLRGGGQAVFAMEGEGIGLQAHLAVGAFDGELVGRAGFEALNHGAPDTVRGFGHGVRFGVPAVEIAHQAHALRRRCPHGEAMLRFARRPGFRQLMAAEQEVRAARVTPAEQVDVGLGQGNGARIIVHGKSIVPCARLGGGNPRTDGGEYRRPPKRPALLWRRGAQRDTFALASRPASPM